MSIKRGRKWWWQCWQHCEKVFWQGGFAKWKSWTEFCPCMCLSEWSRVVYFRNSDFHTSWFGRPLKLDSLVLATSFLPCVQLCATFRSTFNLITGTHLCWMDQKGRNPGRKNSAHKQLRKSVSSSTSECKESTMWVPIDFFMVCDFWVCIHWRAYMCLNLWIMI
jgi:hypothetical protein